MPCGCKRGSGITLHGAGVRRKRRKRGGMAIGGAGMRISGAGYRKRKRGRRKKRGGGIITSLIDPIGSLASIAGRAFMPRFGRGRLAAGVMRAARNVRARGKKGAGGRFLSGATWHGYGKGSGMAISGAGLYGKRLLGRNGSGRRQI